MTSTISPAMWRPKRTIEPRVRRVLDAVYDRLASIEHAFTDEGGPAETVESKPFTAKQGQYLAYIYYYTKVHRRPPAESDLQRFFRVHAAGRASDDQDA